MTDMTMIQAFSHFEFEACLAHFKANPPVGGRVDLEFTEAEIQNVRDHAERYGCTMDVFLSAVVACFMTELQRRDRHQPADPE